MRHLTYARPEDCPRCQGQECPLSVDQCGIRPGCPTGLRCRAGKHHAGINEEPGSASVRYLETSCERGHPTSESSIRSVHDLPVR